VVEPLPADELMGYYREAEAATGIPWYWLAAINLQETRMGRVIGTSSAGAIGPMQFLPSTWALCCSGDPTVPRDAILGAATYLHQSGAPGDIDAALHQYNPNDLYVTTVTAFAENMRDDPALFAAYRDWQVYFTTSSGTVRLPSGYSRTAPIAAAAYLAGHPQDAG
ncbi:MAG: lytic transglycosylase domain-containing protein, partial [Ilumatobacteraceae bacterium]